jgi:hypothetical protein
MRMEYTYYSYEIRREHCSNLSFVCASSEVFVADSRTLPKRSFQTDLPYAVARGRPRERVALAVSPPVLTPGLMRPTASPTIVPDLTGIVNPGSLLPLGIGPPLL